MNSDRQYYKTNENEDPEHPEQSEDGVQMNNETTPIKSLTNRQKITSNKIIYTKIEENDQENNLNKKPKSSKKYIVKHASTLTCRKFISFFVLCKNDTVKANI